jgi:PKD repeat protein
MGVSSRLLVSPAISILLTALVITVIFLAPNFTTTSAQQQQQSTSQPSGTQSPTLLSAKDSFRVQLPQGWVVQDVNNTGFTLAAEVLQGYGVLAQLCPSEQEQSVLSNVSGSNRYIGNCQHAREEVIHIIRYPNLGAILGIASDDDDDDDVFTIINRDTIPNSVLAYHIQKLQEVGYRDIQIVNSIDTTINIDNSTGLNSNRISTTIPAKLIEMTYSTATNETREGYFILTATVATPRNLGMVTGYSVFYEGGNSSSAASAETTIPSSNLARTSLPAPARQVFDSFELVAARTVPLTVETISSGTGGVAPATFEFEADVIGGTGPYTYSWDFDDGSVEVDDDETVEHTFDVAGTYSVGAIVADSSGRTTSDSILVTVEPPPPLTAVEIIASGTRGIAPATFEFEADVIGGTGPYTYSWDFDDGSVEVDDDETVEHTFDVAGSYNVGLTVTDSTGRNVFDSILIIVEPPPPLTAVEIIASGTQGVVPATFQFQADVAGGTGPYTYSWDFDDGSVEVDDDETVGHTFDVAGTYSVDLVVIDSTGQSASDSILINVEEPPTQPPEPPEEPPEPPEEPPEPPEEPPEPPEDEGPV